MPGIERSLSITRLILNEKDTFGTSDSGNLSHEFADVAITTLLLAKSMDVDIEKALEQKMERINQRYEKK